MSIKLCPFIHRRALKAGFKDFSFLQLISCSLSVSLGSVAWKSWKYSIYLPLKVQGYQSSPGEILSLPSFRWAFSRENSE